MRYIIASILFITLLFASCRPQKEIQYVDREVIKYVTQIQHDTLITNIHDSVYHTIFQKGDTIYNTKYVSKIQYKDRIVERIDTMYMDSINIEYKEKVVEITKTPKWCYYCLAISIICFIFAILKIYKWLTIR